MMVQELLSGLVWSAAGFIGGWIACRELGREMLYVHQIWEATVPEEVRKQTTPADSTASNNRLLGWLIVLLALLTTVYGTYSTYENTKQANCQAQYNADFAKVVQLRAQWTTDDKNALNKLLADLLAAKPGQGREILSEYLTAIARTDQLRAQTPLPKLEDRDC